MGDDEGGDDLDTGILQEFVELSKRLNFTETARILNMSQPTLSKHIGAFEKELKLELFDRTNSTLQLTRAGAELLPFAYKMLEAQNDFLAKARELKTKPIPRLSVTGVVDEGVVNEAIGRIITRLRPIYGTNFLEAKSAHHRSLTDILLSGASDIIFDYASESDFADNDNIGAIELAYIPWVALVGKEHRLANRTSIAVEDLREETLIKMEGTHVSGAWEFIERVCRAHGFEPKIRRSYAMKLTDLITASANFDTDILILGTNFVRRIDIGISALCQQVPVIDTDAAFPLSALYRIDNDNPVFQKSLGVLEEFAATRRTAQLMKKAPPPGSNSPLMDQPR